LVQSGSTAPAPRPSYIPHPKEYTTAYTGPFWGALATVFGGFLVALQGVIVATNGFGPGLLNQFLFGSASEGAFMVLYGFGICLLGVVAYYHPGHPHADGALIWLLLLVCNLTAWLVGFYIGSLLVAAGASHIFWWKPKKVGGAGGIARSLKRG